MRTLNKVEMIFCQSMEMCLSSERKFLPDLRFDSSLKSFENFIFRKQKLYTNLETFVRGTKQKKKIDRRKSSPRKTSCQKQIRKKKATALLWNIHIVIPVFHEIIKSVIQLCVPQLSWLMLLCSCRNADHSSLLFRH